MPGLSFLFKKRWHPARQANEKALFLAEQEALHKQQRDDEVAELLTLFHRWDL